QVHAVAQRRDHADAGGAVEARQAPARDGAVDVAYRHPVEVPEIAVDGAAQALEFDADVGIRVDALATRRRDLDQGRAVPRVGVGVQQLAERSNAVRVHLRI